MEENKVLDEVIEEPKEKKENKVEAKEVSEVEKKKTATKKASGTKSVSGEKKTSSKATGSKTTSSKAASSKTTSSKTASSKTTSSKTASSKTSSAKKTTSSTKKSTSTAKKTTAKKDIANPLDDMSPIKKKTSGASSIEKALEKKASDKSQNTESITAKEDMKTRMQRIINASKKLNDSILDEDTKKNQMKERLANAAQEMEAEYGHVEEEPSVADTYSEKNAKLKGKYDDLSKKLAAMMAEANLYDEDAYGEDEVSEEQVNAVLEDVIPETDVISPVTESLVNEETVQEISAPVEEVQDVISQEETPEVVEAVDNTIEETVQVAETAQQEVVVEEIEPVAVEESPEEVVQVAEETVPVEEQVLATQVTNEAQSQEDLGNQIVMDLVKEHREEQAKQEATLETKKEIVKEEIIDTSIPELQEKPVAKKSIFKKILDYVIKTMNGMAYGLFATLIIGTILGTIAGFFADESTAQIVLSNLATLLKNLTGLGIGLGIAWSLKYDGIKLISIACVGAIAVYFSGTKETLFSFKVGDPLTVYLVVIVTSILLDQIFRKKTPVDIIIIPLFTALFGAALTVLISDYISMVTSGLAIFIGTATAYQPILMGIIISVVMGMALTAPISSAAIAAMVFVFAPEASVELQTGLALAGGAALIGCCTQMVGFAIMSRKDNNIGTCIAIGIGTSMLQFKNILKKPIIWLPTIIVSAILGPIATTLIDLQCMGTAAGMGTSGLVGMIGTFDAMGMSADTWLIVLGFEIVLPLVLVLIIDIIFRKLNLIKEGDLKL